MTRTSNNKTEIPRRRRLRWLIPALLLIIVLAWSFWPNDPRGVQATLVSAAAPDDPSGFARAEGPRVLHFPADHGPHPDFQTEWWYYTGNLQSESGEHFGYQLTFFRRALIPPDEQVSRASDWATGQVYMAHLALTDVARGTHNAFERLERGAVGLAGARANPYRVWLSDWSVEEQADGQVLLRAQTDTMALDLVLRNLKEPVLQGDAGYSRKGSDPGNASYYYSLTRVETTGSVRVAGESIPVRGLSWMDHEFSTSTLEPGVVGWDWFSLQLDNGSELMFFRLRHSDGSSNPFSGGTLVAPDGTVQRLSAESVSVEPAGEWRSPHSGGVYPSGWLLELPGADLELRVIPYLADQEMNVSYSYWEGAVKLEGTSGGNAVTGNGYVELTGYAHSFEGQF